MAYRGLRSSPQAAPKLRSFHFRPPGVRRGPPPQEPQGSLPPICHCPSPAPPPIATPRPPPGAKAKSYANLDALAAPQRHPQRIRRPPPTAFVDPLAAAKAAAADAAAAEDERLDHLDGFSDEGGDDVTVEEEDEPEDFAAEAAAADAAAADARHAATPTEPKTPRELRRERRARRICTGVISCGTLQDAKMIFKGMVLLVPVMLY